MSLFIMTMPFIAQLPAHCAPSLIRSPAKLLALVPTKGFRRRGTTQTRASSLQGRSTSSSRSAGRAAAAVPNSSASTADISSNGSSGADVSSSNGSSSGSKSRTVKLTSRGIVWSDDAVEAILGRAREEIGDWHLDMVKWRREIHACPELAFQEHKTSDLVANLLQQWGYSVHRGLGGTGLVGTLTAGSADPGTPAIMLRADMDALPIAELNSFEHRSQLPSAMHACGHDGHTAMLLGAARYLAEKKEAAFQGTVHLVFQPAEEGTPTENVFGRIGGGALAMLEDGLLETFPVRAAFGMHNWPGLPVGRIAVHSGPVMAGVDNFDIQVEGVGCHAAMPHLGLGRDPVLAAAQIVTALQALVSRATDPQDSAVVSVTQIHGGDAYNVIPPTASLKGTIRTFRSETRAAVMDGMKRTAEATAAAFGCSAQVSFRDFFPATVNTRPEAQRCADVARALVGADFVDFDTRAPSMGAEDFGYILQSVPGCYVWIGNGPTEGGCMLHNPLYDFNDDILALGARYWVKLVESYLPPRCRA